MSLGRRWNIAANRMPSVARRTKVESELDRELAFHLDRQIEENLAMGMPPVEARQSAIRKLGGKAQIQEECRDMRRTDYIENLWRDLQYAWRTLGRNPGFTAIIVLTLGLAIGANSAIFSVIDGVLLRPLPYRAADRIVRIFFHGSSFAKFPLNPFDFRDFRQRNRSFESMAAFTHADLQLSGTGHPERYTGFRITAGYFRTLGLKPARGREFTEADEIPGNSGLVILSDRLWRDRFASDPNILGRKIVLDSQPFTVIGVMPPDTEHPGNEYRAVAHGNTVDLWWPFAFEGNPARRGSHFIEGIGRLKKGVSPAQAQAEIDTLIAGINRELSGADEGWQALVIPLYREIVGPSQRLLLVLLGAVGLVLLIACANAANLLLARATARQREIAVRAALGAGRSRLVRQLLAESVLIALLGGCLATGIAIAGVRVLVPLLPAGFPRADAIHVNAAVFGFTLAIAIATGILFGPAPALQAARTDLQQSLRDGRSSTGGGHHRLRATLVIGEVGLACLLLIGAGLMLRSFVNLLRTDPGFLPIHVLTAEVSLPDAAYKPADQIHFYQRLVANLRSVAGVQSAGVGTDLPWTGYDDNIGGLTIEGKKPAPREEFHARYHVASPDYFRALGIPLVHGRFLADGDGMTAPLVLIVNQSMARHYWPGEDAVGKRLAFDDHPKDKDWLTVVGVVGDVKDQPNGKAAENALWFAISQTPVSIDTMAIVVRATSEPEPLIGTLQQSLRQLDPALALADVRLMDQIADASISTPRFALFLVALFAGLALTLAGIGMYGVISYSASQRTHEFGLRMALGAEPWDVQRLVLGQGLRLALTGVALGIAGGLVLGRVLWSLLYQVGVVDPLTLGSVSLIAIAIAVVACYLPARRATMADPMTALRSE